MSDITAKTMVAGFKRLPQRAYLGGYTSYFGSRTHFQLATFYALTEPPELSTYQPIYVICVANHDHLRQLQLDSPWFEENPSLLLTLDNLPLL